MKTLRQTKFSILDLVPYHEHKTIQQALHSSLELARLAQSLGYTRYWVAEHHSIEGISSAAASVVIGYLAAGTSRIRIGSGGIMLPNHSPMMIAEQFGTLETLYPGRIDLGLGRAPGSDRSTMLAVRRGTDFQSEDFGQLIEELEFFFAPAKPGQKVKAIPGAGLNVPLTVLGSSLYSAHLAAKIGRPYAFAGHFAPHQALEALDIYRREFQPSVHCRAPYIMLGVPVVAAATQAEAERLATTVYQSFLNLVRGHPRLSAPPVSSMDGLWNPAEEAHVKRMLEIFVVGGPAQILSGFQQLIDITQADELILSSNFYHDLDRQTSFKIVADVAGLHSESHEKSEIEHRMDGYGT